MFFVPNVTIIIRTLTIIFNNSNFIDDKFKNKKNIVIVPVRLPNTNLFKDNTLFNILLVPYNSKKSKKKLIIKTKSKYIFIISPYLVYK